MLPAYRAKLLSVVLLIIILIPIINIKVVYAKEGTIKRNIIEERFVADLNYLSNISYYNEDKNEGCLSFQVSPDKRCFACIDFECINDSMIYNQIMNFMNKILPFCNKRLVKYYIQINGEKGNMYDDIYIDEFKFSPDSKRFAYVANNNKKSYFILDGEEIGIYDGYMYDSLTFSPDGKRFAYVGVVGDVEDGEFYVIVDGKKSVSYSGIAKDSLEFSADSQHFLYAAYDGGKWSVIVDDKPGRKYDKLGGNVSSLFTPDSQHVVYIAKETINGEKKSFIVKDGIEGKRYDDVWNIVISPDSENIFYEAKEDGKITVILNDRELGTYKYVDDYSLKFSNDSCHNIYTVEKENGIYVIIDGKENGPYKKYKGEDFSPDGDHCIYVMSEEYQGEEKCYMVINGEKSEPYQTIFMDYIFSNDGNRFAYCAGKEGEYYVIIDGKKSPGYLRLASGDSMMFSSDGQRFVYVAEIEEGYWTVILDDKIGKNYDFMTQDSLVFSSDSKHFAYSAGLDGERYFVLDGKEYNGYDGIIYGSITFSPDSNHYAYAVRDDDKEFVVIDGIKGKKYDEIGLYRLNEEVEKDNIIFTDNNRFYYFAIKDNKLYFVEEGISN